jgi:hypothetical protein
MKFWRITISICPDSFRRDNLEEETVESGTEWAAPELTKINVEEFTSQLFPSGDSDENKS